MIVEEWEVVKYSYVNAFILTAYLIGGALYIFFNHKAKTFVKVAIQSIIVGIILLTISFMVTKFSPKMYHIIYRYEDKQEIIDLYNDGWTLIERSPTTHRVHAKREREYGR